MGERVVIDRRYRGFEGVAQGGYSSGLLARLVDAPARISLRRPVPMDRPLEIESGGGGAVLRDGEDVLAEASAAELRIDPPEPVGTEEAEAASSAYPGHRGHPFPGCFCCGPERESGDGLRIFPGPLEGRDAVAAPWVPEAQHADELGNVRSEIVWAAFDCPQLWALMVSAPAESTDHVVTGALQTELVQPVRAGERYTILAWPSGGEGRRLFADAALLTSEGEPAAVSRQTAVLTGAGVPLGLSKLPA